MDRQFRPAGVDVAGPGAGDNIDVESARGHVEVGYWDSARFGIPVTILTTVAGMMILLLLN